MKARPYKAEHGTRWTEVYCITCAEWIPEDEFGPHEGVHAKAKPYPSIVRGFLLQSFDSGQMHFRVYGPNHKTDHRDFVDYEIHHHDLEVDLVGEFDFYERDGRHIVDHSRGVLGIKDE